MRWEPIGPGFTKNMQILVVIIGNVNRNRGFGLSMEVYEMGIAGHSAKKKKRQGG